MNVGDRYTLRWHWPHRQEAVIVEIRDDGQIVADVEHRCDPPCYLAPDRETLVIEGRLTFLTREFHQLYEPMAPPDALALPSPK